MFYLLPNSNSPRNISSASFVKNFRKVYQADSSIFPPKGQHLKYSDFLRPPVNITYVQTYIQKCLLRRQHHNSAPEAQQTPSQLSMISLPSSSRFLWDDRSNKGLRPVKKIEFLREKVQCKLRNNIKCMTIY